jgi:hypothetical protein
LDAAWPRYAKVLPLVRRGAASVEPKPQDVLRKVADLLAIDRRYSMQVLVYVGEFDNNAFSFRQDGKPVAAIPLEMSTERRELVFTHERLMQFTWRRLPCAAVGNDRNNLSGRAGDARRAGS